MNIIENRVFSNEDITLDDNRFVGCTFNQCRLVYRGGELPTFVRCEFEGVSIQLEDSAFSTMQYLGALYQSGLDKPVETALTDLGIGRPVGPVPKNKAYAAATGTNYAELLGLNAVIIGVAVVIVAMLLGGFLEAPKNTLENNEPLREEIPLSAMPALPESLGVLYDDLRTDQQADLVGYRWIDEEQGIVSIPVEDAYTLILEDGPPNWSATGEGE